MTTAVMASFHIHGAELGDGGGGATLAIPQEELQAGHNPRYDLMFYDGKVHLVHRHLNYPGVKVINIISIISG